MATVVPIKTNELEDKLAMLAFRFRQAGSDSSRCGAIAREYEQVFDELVGVAGRFVEPHLDSLLPDGYMPKAYEERKAQAGCGVGNRTTKRRWILRVIPAIFRPLARD